MGITVEEAINDLEKIAEEHPEAELRVDPPFHTVLGIYYREHSNVVEITH